VRLGATTLRGVMRVISQRNPWNRRLF